MTIKNFNLAVIGAGPGGYVAAIRAAQLGLSVAVIEREHLGGICLNWGCIPTKALLKSADVLREMRRASDYGLAAVSVAADLPAVVRRSRSVAAQLQAGVKHLLKKNKVTVIEGDGKLIANAGANAAGAAQIAVSRKDAPVEKFSAKSIPTAGWCGLTAERWSPRRCRHPCSSSVPEPSASNLPASTARWEAMSP